MRLANIRFTIVIVIAGLAFTACSKPPGCADADTLQVIREIVSDNTLKELEELSKDDPDNLLKKFVEKIKIEVMNVVSEGYKEDAKKQLCKGNLKIVTIEGKTYERLIEYSSQRTEEKRGFLVEIAAFQPFVIATRADARSYYGSNRWSGDWGGTYSCSGLGGSGEGLQGPFSRPATLRVKGMDATLERTTLKGGFEKLTGYVNLGGVKLTGEGKNSPDDTWKTDFNGTVNGRNLVADGNIRLQDGTRLRDCKLQLTQNVAAIAVTTAPATTQATPVASAPVAGLSEANSTKTSPALLQQGSSATVVVQKADLCGEEAFCVTTDKGIFRTNIFQLPKQSVQIAETAAKNKSAICLTEVSKIDGHNYFNGIATTCSVQVAEPASPVSAPASETCLVLARTGMVVGGQEDMCKFKDNLKEKVKDLYNAKGCGKLVQREDLDKAASEVDRGIMGHYAQAGHTAFCNDARSSYRDRAVEFEKAKKALITGKN